MKAPRPAPAASMAGPLRWSYKQYTVQERRTPLGRRFEIRSPKGELVVYCRVRKAEPGLTFFADDKEAVELFRLVPKKVRQFDRAFSVVDAYAERAFAELRRKQYKPLEKAEWFMHDADGDLIGMVTETAPQSSFLRRILPMERFFPKAWALHWGQSIGGIIQPKAGLMGERVELNLSLDTRDEIDRRLAIAVTVLIRTEQGPAAEDGA